MGGRRTTEPFLRAYQIQKSNARTRGVEFALTFDEWKELWIASGKWGERGRGSEKYCMCRTGDTGPYAVGNVYIDTNHKNLSDGNLGRVPSEETREKISVANTGKPHPWSEGASNPMHRPEVKAKVSEAIGGEKHYRAVGVTTPGGFFVTAKVAAIALGIPKATVEWRARHNKSGYSQGRTP